MAWTAPNHYLNQCRNIINFILRNKLQWNFNRYSNIFIQENPCHNVVWKMAAILSRPQCVKIGSGKGLSHRDSQLLVCDLNRTPIVMAKHGGPCVHFSGISTCGRTSRETVSHPQHAPLPTLCKISLPVYIIVTNERLQPLTRTWYNSLMLSFPLLKI